METLEVVADIQGEIMAHDEARIVGLDPRDLGLLECGRFHEGQCIARDGPCSYS